jgi:hypothetical protein
MMRIHRVSQSRGTERQLVIERVIERQLRGWRSRMGRK